MNVICTGISKCDKMDYFKEVKKYSKELHKSGKGTGKDVQVYSIGDVMQECLKRHTTVNEHILNKDDETLAQAAETAIKTLKIKFQEEKLKGKEDKHNIIGTHTTFIWKNHWKDSHSEDLLDILEPDLFVTILDHEKRIQERQLKDSQWAMQNPSLEAIALWQDREVKETEKWAKRFGKRHIVIGRNQSPETLYKMINYPNSPIFYSNFPMTYLKNIEESYKKITANNNELNKYGPVIDPRTIEIMKPEEGGDYSYTPLEREMQLIIERKKAHNLMSIAEKMLTDCSDQVDKDTKERVTITLKELKDSVDKGNINKIKEKAYLLSSPLQEIDPIMYQHAIQNQEFTDLEKKVDEHLNARKESEKKIIKYLTVHRDLDYYVAKVDVDILYFPELVLSFGGVAEVIKAHRCSKETYLILPEELKAREVGPFEVYHSLKIFFGTQEFHDFLSKRFKVLDMYK